ncbi:MAG: TerC family protein [Desulfitobacterium sp.]|nr:TerC family protein [Desulfitobacterium sp.]
MELFSPEFFSALISIIIMDLVLGGDNAIVIGMAARNLPAEQQKKVIFMGAGGAVLIRTIATVLAVHLLKIPGLMFAGGLLLVWMAYKLLTDDKESGGDIKSASNIWGAVKTIIIADAVMGLDNVLAVAGAAKGEPLLVILGLLISIPIVVWGSTLVIKAINRFPIIIPVGAAVITHTAVTMILAENFVKNFIPVNALLEWGLSAVLITLVLFLGHRKNKANEIEPTKNAAR